MVSNDKYLIGEILIIHEFLVFVNCYLIAVENIASVYFLAKGLLFRTPLLHAFC